MDLNTFTLKLPSISTKPLSFLSTKPSSCSLETVPFSLESSSPPPCSDGTFNAQFALGSFLFLISNNGIYSINLNETDLLYKVLSWDSTMPALDGDSNWIFIPPNKLLRHTEPIEFFIKGGSCFELLQLDSHPNGSLPFSSSLSSKLSSWKSHLLDTSPSKSPLEISPFSTASKEMMEKIDHSIEEQTRMLRCVIAENGSTQSLLELFKLWRGHVFPLLVDLGETLCRRRTIVQQEYERQALILKTVSSHDIMMDHLKKRIDAVSTGLSKLRERMDSIVALSLTNTVLNCDRLFTASQTLSMDLIKDYETKYEVLEDKLFTLRESIDDKVPAFNDKEQPEVPLHILFDELGLSERY